MANKVLKPTKIKDPPTFLIFDWCWLLWKNEQLMRQNKKYKIDDTFKLPTYGENRLCSIYHVFILSNMNNFAYYQ